MNSNFFYKFFIYNHYANDINRFKKKKNSNNYTPIMNSVWISIFLFNMPGLTDWSNWSSCANFVTDKTYNDGLEWLAIIDTSIWGKKNWSNQNDINIKMVMDFVIGATLRPDQFNYHVTCDGLRAIIKLQVGHKKVIDMDLKELICTKWFA